MTTTRNDVTEVVLDQHHDVARRLAAVLDKTGGDRAGEFESLAEVIAAHESAEESVVYPALRKLGDEGSRIADDRTREEAGASEALTKLQGLDVGSPAFEAMFTEFSAKVHGHAASEESEVLPLLTRTTTAEERQVMGNAFLKSQEGVPGHR